MIKQTHYYLHNGVKYANMKEASETLGVNGRKFRHMVKKGLIIKHLIKKGYENGAEKI